MTDPIKAWLRAQQSQAVAVLRAGLPLTRSPEALTDAEWEHLGGELMDAMRALLTASTALRRLPRTTACVCPSCKTIVLPEGPMWDAYSHCGRLWLLGPSHLPLPADFWETARPGDIYKGAIAASWAEEEEQHGSQDEKQHRRGTRSARKAAS